MADIAPELVERMANHLRACIADIPDRPRHDARSQALWDELKAITDLLPTPVDPDLIEARKLVANTDKGKVGSAYDADVLAGKHDASWDVEVTLAAIKRGRELAREQGK